MIMKKSKTKAKKKSSKKRTKTKHKKNKDTLKIIGGVVGIVAILIILFYFTGTGMDDSGEKSESVDETGTVDAEKLAKCLTSKGVIMYGTSWCGHCNNQKNAFGEAFEYVDFIDCDNERKICVEAGIRGYPSWIINGQIYPGARQLDQLADLSEC